MLSCQKAVEYVQIHHRKSHLRVFLGVTVMMKPISH